MGVLHNYYLTGVIFCSCSGLLVLVLKRWDRVRWGASPAAAPTPPEPPDVPSLPTSGLPPPQPPRRLPGLLC